MLNQKVKPPLSDLEEEKIRLEINNLRKPFFKKISFWSSISPILVGAFAILWAFLSGWFDNQNDLLEIKKENLKYDISVFEKDKDSLQFQMEKLNFQIDSLNIVYNKINLQYNKLFNDFKVTDSLKAKYLKENIELADRIKALMEQLEINPMDQENIRNELKFILKSLDKLKGSYSDEYSDEFDR
jgi:hypothetical protein